MLPHRILSFAEEWAAISADDCVDLLDEFRGPVREALAGLVAEGLLARLDDVYYLTDTAMKYVAARDRISVTTVRNRLLSYLNAGGHRHRHDLEHNRHILEVVRIFKRAGITVHGGWRAVQHMESTQVQADGVVYADGPYGRGLYFIEFERTATTPKEVTKKLQTYRRALDKGIRLRVAWITETRQAADRFLRRGRHLDVMVTTLDQLRGGTIAGPETVWRAPNSQNPGLRPYGDS